MAPTRSPERVSSSTLNGSPCWAAVETKRVERPPRAGQLRQDAAASRAGGGGGLAGQRGPSGESLQAADVPAAADDGGVVEHGHVPDIARAALCATVQPAAGY